MTEVDVVTNLTPRPSPLYAMQAAIPRMRQHSAGLIITIRQLVDSFRRRYPHLHVLINNAGAGFTQRQESVDGLEMTFAVNYLSSASPLSLLSKYQHLSSC